MDYKHSRFLDARLYDDFACSTGDPGILRVGAIEDQDGVFLDAHEGPHKTVVWLSWADVMRLRSLLKSLSFEGAK